MGNLCAIYHAHYDKLLALMHYHSQRSQSAHAKAVLLDKCLFWWQVSHCTLNNDDKIWFSRSLSEIANAISMSERSVSRFLSEFEKLGFIEKVCKLGATDKDNPFSISKKLYINITDKLLHALKLSKDNFQVKKEKTPQNSFNLNQTGVIDKDNLASSIYKGVDQKSVVNNTVSFSETVDKKPVYPTFAVESLIGDNLSTKEKNYIKGMLFNLITQKHAKISSVEQTFSEIVFSVTNKEQFKDISHFNHKIQIISKLLRENRWRTPKGFNNYSGFAPVTSKKPESSKGQGKPFDKYQLKKDIKKLSDELQIIHGEIHTNQCLLQQDKGLDGLSICISRTLAKLSAKKQDIEFQIRQKEEQLKTVMISFGDSTTDKLKQYNRYCYQQTQLEKSLNHLQHEMDQIISNYPDDTLLIIKKRNEYREKYIELEQLNDKIFEIGEQLSNGKAA